MIGWRLTDLANIERRRPLDAGERCERLWLMRQASRAPKPPRGPRPNIYAAGTIRLASVQAEIGALDAANRRRSLTARETDRLVHLIAIERHELQLAGRAA